VTAVWATTLLRRRRYQAALLLSIVSVVLAASVVRLFSIDVPLDDTGTQYRLQHLALGFWVWLLSLLVPGMTAVWLQRGSADTLGIR
jgi:NhaP-type Na+/H+ or K+/H+ antiporter